MSTLEARLDARTPVTPVWKPITEMEPQEIFNRVAYHLARQGVKSVGPGGVCCQYRGEHGRKCAAGIFIPDALYDEEFEGMGVNATPVASVLGLEEDSPTIVLLRCLQRAHDDHSGGFERRLRAVARDYHLNPEILDIVF